MAGAAAVGLAAPGAAQTPGVTDNEIVIGLFAPLSGPLIGYGLDPLQAARMWYEETNKNGGIHGRKIRLVIEDSQCKPNELVSVVKKLVTVDKVFMLHGGSCTSALAAAQEFVTREKVPLVTINAASDNVVIPPTRYMFGAFGGVQRVYGAALAEFAAKTLKAKTAAIIVHDDDYGKANLQTAQAVFERLGVEVVAAQRIPPSITDITAPMLNVRAAKPDVILSGAYPAPAVLIAQKYAEYGMTDIPLLQAPQGIPSPPDFAKNVDNAAAFANFYYAWPFTNIADKAIHDHWFGMYKQYYPDRDPTPFMISGLPSALTVTTALQQAGRDLTREGLVETMQKLSFQPDMVPGPVQFGPDRRDAVRATLVVRFDGKASEPLTGTYSWNGQDGRQ